MPTQITKQVSIWQTLERILAVLTFISIVITSVKYLLEGPDRKLQREADQKILAIATAQLAELENQEEQLEQQKQQLLELNLQNSWARLAERVPGNGGKRRALEYLSQNDVLLAHLDLSCETIGGPDDWDAKENSCVSSVVLGDIDLSNQNLAYSDFRGVNFESANLDKAILRRVDFRGANITGASFKGANLSDANFEGLINIFISPSRFEGAWYFHTMAPNLPDEFLEIMVVCQYSWRDHPLLRPSNC